MKNFGAKFWRLLLFCLFNIILVLAVFFLFEGISSVILLWQDTAFTPPVAERSHTRYDEQLGWVNRPNVLIKDMYGPGLDLKTNAQGFRNEEDFEVAAPQNRQRIICSGDSFTLGYGVHNQDTWCHLIEAADSQIQTVNMGQGGYGIDQAYLWYKRDGVKLDHDIHLFTFITTDFERMQQSSFLGYGKPLLKIEQDNLILDNVPVPRRSFYVPWITQNSGTIKQLKSIELLSQYVQSPVGPEPDPVLNQAHPQPELVAAKILSELHRINQAQDSTLVLVYLPTLGDYDPGQAAATEYWRQNIHNVAQEQGIPYIDLIEAFRLLPVEQVNQLFLHEAEVDFPGAAGHYSVQGNQFVAQKLHEKLLSFPEVSIQFVEKDQ